MKINRYQYKCDQCGKGYIEQRRENEPHYIINCDCGGSYIEESVTFVEEIALAISDPAPIDPIPAE
jgi:uncharacterized Zn finger protein